jgi:hypothetical protein
VSKVGEAKFCFEASSWGRAVPHILELTKVDLYLILVMIFVMVVMVVMMVRGRAVQHVLELTGACSLYLIGSWW